MNPTKLNQFYTSDINQMTLRDAITEHYNINPQFTPYYEFETLEAGSTIKSHDISHIIYGCDTSYLGEYKVQMWNNFGSSKTMPKISFKLIFSKDARALIQLVLPTGLIKFAREHKVEMDKVKAKIKTQSAKMTKKWIYSGEEKYMDKTIGEVREEYGIQILN
jgi:ubiquinone biosynthesis protein Coq4